MEKIHDKKRSYRRYCKKKKEKEKKRIANFFWIKGNLLIYVESETGRLRMYHADDTGYWQKAASKSVRQYKGHIPNGGAYKKIYRLDRRLY